MSTSTMQFSAQFAQALIDWDDNLFRVHQARHHAKVLIEPLDEMGLYACSKNARRIFQDIDLQMRTGELLIRMRAQFAEDHAMTTLETEQWRQFTNTALVFYELSAEEEETEYGRKVVSDHGIYIAAAQAAHSMKETVS